MHAERVLTRDMLEGEALLPQARVCCRTQRFRQLRLLRLETVLRLIRDHVMQNHVASGPRATCTGWCDVWVTDASFTAGTQYRNPSGVSSGRAAQGC